jgi:hypothetical protein
MHKITNVFNFECSRRLSSIDARGSHLFPKHVSLRSQMVPFSPGPKPLGLSQPPNLPSIVPSWARQFSLPCKNGMVAQHSGLRPHVWSLLPGHSNFRRQVSSLLPEPKSPRQLRCWGRPMSLFLGARMLVGLSRGQSHKS